MCWLQMGTLELRALATFVPSFNMALSSLGRVEGW